VYSFPNSAAAAALALLVPLVVLLVWASRCGIARRLAGLPPWQRALAILGLCILVGYGGDKPAPQPAARIYELLAVLRDGSLKDSRGRVVSGTQAAALDAYAGEAWQIAAAMSNIVEAARADCIDLTNQLAQADYSAAYIALDLPRGTPAELNHNIMVGFERVEQTPTNISALVWFSEMPATNVNVRIQYSVAEGVWTQLAPVANHWPETEIVNGVECVRYCYALPPAVAGIPLRPQYEVEFGGYADAEYLSVPEEGVTVTVGAAEYLPYTGWDIYEEGQPDELRIRYVGGIAVEVRQYGITTKGAGS